MGVNMKFLTTILIAIFAIALTLNARDMNHKKGGVQLWIPDSWKVEMEDEDSFEAYDKSEEVYLYFEVLDGEDAKATLDSLEKELEKEVKNLKITDEQELTLNGMEGYNIDAEGTVEGEKVGLNVLLLKTKTNKILLLNGYILMSAFNKHEATLVKILKSVKSL